MSKPFELGICMAGAVSAGAYTAGVMDFLLEALQTWEERRNDPGVPTHEVIIKAIGGASAGGMTGIITASVLNDPLESITELDQADFWKEQTQNKLYNTWVDLLKNDMFPMMLDTDDIKRGKVYSLLNSSFIDQVGKKAMIVSEQTTIRPYVEKNIKFFTTLTNLEGFPYNIEFKSGGANSQYNLSEHKDYGAFVLSTPQSPISYNGDGWIPVNFKTGENADIALQCAMATGAFPGGLKPRKVWRDIKYVNDLDWNKPVVSEFKIENNAIDPVTKAPTYEALIVDGGTINNEPFEQVGKLLEGKDDNEDKSKGKDEFSSTTLMIDPFPSYIEDFDLSKDYMLPVLGKTLSAMLSQMRTKPEVLKEINEANSLSKFQIAPVRYDHLGERIEGSKAISCGFLGGFGGFIHKEFRIHDFFLGRANCERFLREHFTVPIDTINTIFKEGYNGVDPKKYCNEDGTRRQIIPIFKPESENKKPYMPVFESGTTWPCRDENDILRFERQIRRRTTAVLLNTISLNPLQKYLLRLGNDLFLNKAISKGVLKSIKKAMKDHELL